MTEPVLNFIKEYKICLVKVPANMTDIFQSLDLTVNRSAKSFFKRKFTQWYSSQIQRGTESGEDNDEIEVKLNLTTLKPLHAAWIMEFYDLMTYDQGKSSIKNGWKASGITGVIESGLANLPSIDSFAGIDPLITEPTIGNNESPIPEEEIVERSYARDWHDGSVEEREVEAKAKLFDDVNDDGEWTFTTNRTFDIKCFSFFFILDFESKIKKSMHNF